jgi:hypothetical protein
MSRAIRFLVFKMRFGYLIIAAGFVWYLLKYFPYRQYAVFRVYDWNRSLCIVIAVHAIWPIVFFCGLYYHMSTTEEQGIPETEKSSEAEGTIRIQDDDRMEISGNWEENEWVILRDLSSPYLLPEPSPITHRPEQDSPEYPRSH